MCIFPCFFAVVAVENALFYKLQENCFFSAIFACKCINLIQCDMMWCMHVCVWDKNCKSIWESCYFILNKICELENQFIFFDGMWKQTKTYYSFFTQLIVIPFAVSHWKINSFPWIASNCIQNIHTRTHATHGLDFTIYFAVFVFWLYEIMKFGSKCWN